MNNTAVNAEYGATMDDIQIRHRDEVLKRIANFKEKSSDVQI